MRLGILGNLASFSTSTTPANYAAIDKEIRDGLKNETQRLDKARVCRDYFEGRFEPYMTEYGRLLGIRDDAPNRRSIPYVRSIINALTRRLYMADPKRTITDQPEVTEYLQSLYSKGRLTPKIKDSIKYAGLGGACAIQVELNQPKTDGEVSATLAMLRPAVNFRIWAPDEFAVWCSPDEPLTPWAVAVRDLYDNQTRWRLWTPETFSVYTSKKWDGSAQTRGTRMFEKVSEEPNFLGLVPFAFTWWAEPTKDFWTWCPGPELVSVNEQANARLSKIADDTLFTRPITYSQGVSETWKPPDRYRAGDIIPLATMYENVGDAAIPASIESSMADLSYLLADREELEAHLELQGEMHGVPKEQWRLNGANAASGVAIISEQLPIIEACEERQVLMESTEKDLAVLTLMVVSRWLGEQPGANDIVGKINAAIDTFDMSIDWPPLAKNRPGPDFDAHLQFLLINGLASPVQVIQQMTGQTEEEALESLTKKAEHEAYLASIAPPVPGAEAAPDGGNPPDAANGTEDKPEDDPEDDNEDLPK